MTYYNENAKYPAQWLARLMEAGLISRGVVDGQSIVTVRPRDLEGHTRAHFFSGVGGWELACQLAGWPADRPIWTGSCPCQPFSPAGKGGGVKDPRHLWPAWFRLIEVVRPPLLVGEQVPAAVKYGWLDAVFDDLEGIGYSCGAIVLPACSVGAPHVRERLFWVANSDGHELEGPPENGPMERRGLVLGCASGGMGYAELHGPSQEQQSGREEEKRGMLEHQGPDRGPWSDLEWLQCSDGKLRPAQPGLRLMADGFPGRVAQIAGLGNAIVPQVAAEFLKLVKEVLQ